MPHPVESTFTLGGHRLAYTTYGEGPRVTVLVHGLLLNQRMHSALARALADRGNRVVTIDLLGHGRSDRPADMWRYSMSTFGAQVIALLDHLEVDEAVVLGTSLGANTTLEAASLAPERLRGMVIEMPVLDHALIGCALAFTPLMVALTAGAPAMKLLSAVTRRIPRLPWQADILFDTVRQQPEPSAAVLQGLFFGRTARHQACPPGDQARQRGAEGQVDQHRRERERAAEQRVVQHRHLDDRPAQALRLLCHHVERDVRAE